MFNWWPFQENGEQFAKVPLAAVGGCTHATYSLTPSDFVFFSEQELSREFFHPVIAAIQLVRGVWATCFGYLLTPMPTLEYMLLLTYVYTVVSPVSCLFSHLHLGPDHLQ